MRVPDLDPELYRDVNQLAEASPWAHQALVDYAKYGIVLFGLVWLVAWWRARRALRAPAAVSLVACVALGAVVALAVNIGVADAVARPRPFVALAHVELLLPHAADYSFPSDHCAVAGAIAAGLWLRERLLAAVATVGALLMAFARVYVGVHYPGDVVAGLLVGALVAVPVALLAGRLLVPVFRRLAHGPARALVVAR